jgi:hypothetical protein
MEAMHDYSDETKSVIALVDATTTYEGLQEAFNAANRLPAGDDRGLARRYCLEAAVDHRWVLKEPD